MSTKASTAQPPGRRTPLSLNAGTKQTNKQTNENNKKDTNTNNQKTENPKKDTQQSERKSYTDKKHSSSEARKPSSSSESKKSSEEVKTNKNEENKKSQNGFNTNGVKDKEKQNTSDSASKPETSAVSSSAPKRESQKSSEKKKETTIEVAPPVEAKIDEKKNKADEKTNEKEKTNDGHNKKLDEKKKEKDQKKEVVVDKGKVDDEKITGVKNSLEHAKGQQIKPAEEIMDITDLSSSDGQRIVDSLGKENKSEELEILKTPVKEKQTEPTPTPPPIEEEMLIVPSLPEQQQLQDIEMIEPISFEDSSSKISSMSTPARNYNRMDTYHHIDEPSKCSPKSEVKPSRAPLTQSPDRKSCPRTFSTISGRRSIRPIGDYTFSGNLHIRESYRKINTELDFTTSSMNVTVGSEVPNNDSFSFFSRSRKRDRSSPTRQSTMEVQGDISPKSPKRPRFEIDMTGILSAMASPISMLRARLARATVQSTPKKQVEVAIEDDIVENVSGIAVDEDITTTEDLTVNPDSTSDNIVSDENHPKCDEELAACLQKPTVDGEKYEDDIKIKETLTSTDSQAKKKCSIM